MSDEPAVTDTPAPTLGQWEELTTAMARLGKQQLRANQQLEMLANASTEQREEHRRVIQALNDEARDTRLALLPCIDQLDDLMAVALPREDKAWIERVSKLMTRTVRVLQDIGVTEIPAANEPFDEHVHEAMDVVDAGDRPQFVIVEVLRRGFMYRGAVLRRAQVVATK